MREMVLDFLQKEIDLEHIPGGAVSVSLKGEVLLEEAIGYQSIYPEKQIMKLNTIFDIASLTKVVATLPVLLKLMEVGEIRLDDVVSFFLPKFAKNGKESITLRDLLTHTSGLPAYRQYYKEGLNKNQIVSEICDESLEYETGRKVIYSDLGLIILYKLIETVTGEKFEVFLQREFFTPMEMKETGFNPAKNIDRFAPTEFSKELKEYKRGVVHDENAETMGGVSGHAGLFSTLKDLQNYSSMIENNGKYKGKTILSESVIELSKENYTPFAKEYRGLGWLLKGPSLSSCGDLFSQTSYGHTGFTGTSVWFDPEAELNVILLTNRVHLGRQPQILRLRPRLHNIIRSHL
ncbi:class A beta-lactamase-related serine hydrolase [Bacillus salacetis]|uniref:Class A beta-lactamase-related serine hydrolase n=1 Tax=Bacillus salacetis TaxID=2315464 RepID=A0A3A1QYP0_9BACI|nr:serine hydrolase domain-containing protein [Bacillus salacetis]RIW34227.1 class A beta-lactamase-related serine hydrolase [Bacillus salacetis]